MVLMPNQSASVADAKRGSVRPWVLAFLAFLFIIGAWSVAAPYDGTPDEMQHIFRAAGVVSGQIMPEPAEAVRGSGAYQDVPRGLVRDTSCWRFQPTVSASCAAEPGSDSTLVSIGTGAGRYHPFYYALVGWPLVLWPGWAGVILARLISAALASALLASALVTILRYSKYRLPLAGLLVAVTPMTGHMAGAVNPNGLEIAAGVAFFAAAIPLLIGRAAGRTSGVLWLAGISAVLMAMLRTTGLLYLAFGFLALLLPIKFAQLKSLWRSKPTRIWGILLALTAMTSAIWIVKMEATDLGDFNLNGRILSFSQSTMFTFGLFRQYLDEIVGVTGWLDTNMAPPIYLAWEAAAAGLILIAILYGTRTDKCRLFTIFLGGFALPMGMQIYYANTVGFITQGRYLLPMLVGLVLLAGFIAEENGFGAGQSRKLVRLYAMGLLPIHFACLMYTMMRWQRGMPYRADKMGFTSFNPFGGAWQPQLGTVLPVALEVAGLLLFGYLAWRALSPVAQSSESQLPETAEPRRITLNSTAPVEA